MMNIADRQSWKSHVVYVLYLPEETDYQSMTA